VYLGYTLGDPLVAWLSERLSGFLAPPVVQPLKSLSIGCLNLASSDDLGAVPPEDGRRLGEAAVVERLSERALLLLEGLELAL
jgi:hypothetical protein